MTTIETINSSHLDNMPTFSIERKTAYNSTFAIGGVSCSASTLVVKIPLSQSGKTLTAKL
jgi:hypothetical protein